MPTVLVRSIAVLAILLTVACKDPTSPELSALAAAESRWRDAVPAGRPYTMQQRVACFCPTGGAYFTVRIVGGVVTTATNVQTGADAPTWVVPLLKTVPQLFDEIRRATATRGALVAVAYDPTLGYPTTVSLDPVKNAVDDEIAYETRSVIIDP
ncbi:MAG: hypothetical protein IT353_03405 [Gemmatimonadaceae bacterium]|nr:hypothetical protein [Gemmatimonadaceae bacterium]